MNFSAIILAGGLSRRMGTDKAFLQKDGRTLLQRGIGVVRAAGAAEVFVSGRAGVEYSASNCPVLLDLVSGQGPVAGIERGLHAASHDLLLVMAVDLPRMNAELLAQVFSACDPNTGVIPEVNGGLEPLAAVYPKQCHRLAVDFLQTSFRSAREFAVRCIRAGLIRRLEIAPRLGDAFLNWNEPGLNGDPAPPRL